MRAFAFCRSLFHHSVLGGFFLFHLPRTSSDADIRPCNKDSVWKSISSFVDDGVRVVTPAPTYPSLLCQCVIQSSFWVLSLLNCANEFVVCSSSVNSPLHKIGM